MPDRNRKLINLSKPLPITTIDPPSGQTISKSPTWIRLLGYSYNIGQFEIAATVQYCVEDNEGNLHLDPRGIKTLSLSSDETSKILPSRAAELTQVELLDYLSKIDYPVLETRAKKE